MAAYDIQKHFKGLRADTGRRKGRPDPFATGFEDDSDEQKEQRRSRSKTKQAAAGSRAVDSAKTTTSPTSSTNKLPSASQILRDTGDDFLGPPKRTDRRLSPAPLPVAQSRGGDPFARRGSVDTGVLSRSLPGRGPTINRDPRSAVVQAAGALAFLDDSSSDEEPAPRSSRIDRNPSPAPTKSSGPSQRSSTPKGQRSSTPKGSRDAPSESGQTSLQPPRHTVASAFAGTKYLQDSDSDSDEAAVVSRNNSIEEAVSDASARPDRARNEVKRVDKPKVQHGGGVSWRAFSEGRAEQRNQEIEALQTRLKQRGKSISFGSHALTDDGNRVPVQSTLRPRGASRRNSRDKSPPRSAKDTEPTEDEVADGSGLGIYDPAQFKTNPFTGQPAIPREIRTRHDMITGPHLPAMPSLTSESTVSPSSDNGTASPATDDGGLEGSVSSLTSKISPPQTIHEGIPIDVPLSPVFSSMEMISPLSRDPSTRSLRTYSRSRPTRIPNSGSRRSSRRSTSANPPPGASPAQAFLSSWSRDGLAAEAAAEPRPDDEGQSIGLNEEYIIGRQINQGGFGVVKEVHTISPSGERLIRAVKIVRKSIPGKDEMQNERAQQELEHEVSIWRHLKHRHVLELHAVYDTDYATFCVMDLNVGGTLFDLVRRARGSASENDGRRGLEPKIAKSYAYQLACALRYLHEDIRVCHRDVKLENCLVDMTVPNADTDGGYLRLCDFGLADFLHSEQSADYVMMAEFGSSPDAQRRASIPTTSSIIGTLEYASPKGLSVHRKLFETSGDVWAFGVIVYVLCTGELPFRHAMPAKTVELIMQADWDVGALLQAAAGGNEVRELVQGCLEKDVDLRLNIAEVLRSAWFEGCVELGEEEERGVWS